MTQVEELLIMQMLRLISVFKAHIAGIKALNADGSEDFGWLKKEIEACEMLIEDIENDYNKTVEEKQ